MGDGKEKRMALIKKAQSEHCNKCEKENGKKDIDACFQCPWHRLYNLLYELEETN